MKYLPVLLILSAMGCGVRAPIEGQHDPFTPPQVTFADPRLAKRTAIGTPVLTRDPQSQLLYVQVPIRNLTDHQFPVDYRVKFVDRNGQVLNETGWAHKYLAPNVPDQISVNSLSSRAADFQLDLREAR